MINGRLQRRFTVATTYSPGIQVMVLESVQYSAVLRGCPQKDVSMAVDQSRSGGHLRDLYEGPGSAR